MNNNRGNNRRRGRNNNNRQQGGGQQVNRIDSRARGNAPQLLEKYRKLAHDSHLNGDRVTEEYYLQFADHYFRVIADQRQRQEEQRLRRDDRWQDGAEQDGDESEYTGEYGAEPDYMTYNQPQRREREDRVRPDERQRSEEREPRPVTPRAENTDEQAAASDAQGVRTVYEPTENPFVRENRSAPRGLRPRRDDRRPQSADRSSEAEIDADGPAGLDPATLPPAITVSREVAPAPETAEEVKPKRRTRRTKPPADDAGEALQTVG